jgi:hypothetical protein
MFADAEPAVSKGTAITTITAPAIIITTMTTAMATIIITTVTFTLGKGLRVSKCPV